MKGSGKRDGTTEISGHIISHSLALPARSSNSKEFLSKKVKWQMDREDKLEIYETAFRGGTGHSRFECNCGKVFYNSNGKWDWEEGELETLEGTGATDLDHTVGTVLFEEKEYSADCDCWHERALLICDFLISHNHQIIELFKDYKKTMQAKVDYIQSEGGE